jgi:hypothetical protein
VFWIWCAALLSTLWNLKKELMIEGKFPYKISMYLQVWKSMARRQDCDALELKIGWNRTLHAHMKDRPDPS